VVTGRAKQFQLSYGFHNQVMLACFSIRTFPATAAAGKWSSFLVNRSKKVVSSGMSTFAIGPVARHSDSSGRVSNCLRLLVMVFFIGGLPQK
jgi:hypothetical protein